MNELAGEKVSLRAGLPAAHALQTSVLAAPPAQRSDAAIQVDNLGKCYRIWEKPQHRLLQAVFKDRRYYRDFWALRGISLRVERGETVGVLGQNGSGKSTLLQIMAGTLAPSEGEVRVNGRVAALLELGSGFNPEFSGRENVILNGAIQGFTRQQMLERFDRIASFADIGDFIDQPVKVYSSGMAVRLAFSVAINVDPEILIVDEALSVGDARFQQRCMARIREIRDAGTSILFVTHDTEACKRLCQRVYVLDHGKVVNFGTADMMANWYLAFLTSLDNDLVRMGHTPPSFEQAPPAQATSSTEPIALGDGAGASGDSYQKQNEFVLFRHGDGMGSIESCQLLHADCTPADAVYLGETIVLRLSVVFKVKLERWILGFYLKDRLGTDLIGINTFQERTEVPAVEPGSRVVLDFEFPIFLRPAYYSFTLGLAYSQNEMKYLDYIDHALVFRVLDKDPERNIFGLFHVSEIKIRASLAEGAPSKSNSDKGAGAAR